MDSDREDRIKSTYDRVHPLYERVLDFAENRPTGQSPLELSRQRESAQSQILDIMSDYFGVKVHHTPIDANGEVMFTAVSFNQDGSEKPLNMGCGKFGQQWTKALSAYPQRCGIDYHLNIINEDSGWVRLNHFSVDGVVMDFHDHLFAQISAMQTNVDDLPTMGL